MEQTYHPLDRVSDRRHTEFACFFPAQLTAEIDIPIFYDLKCIASRFVAAKDTHGPVRLSSAFFLLFLVFAISSGVTESFRMGTEIHDTCI
jgi:hypothetical protein